MRIIAGRTCSIVVMLVVGIVTTLLICGPFMNAIKHHGVPTCSYVAAGALADQSNVIAQTAMRDNGGNC